MANSSVHKGFGAIGSERKTGFPNAATVRLERPSSHQEEASVISPRLPRNGNTSSTYGLREEDHPQKSSRSTSFPANGTSNPQLAPLTHSRTHPHRTARADITMQPSPPPSQPQHYRFGLNTSSPRSTELIHMTYPSVSSAVDRTPAYQRTPASREQSGDIGYQLSPSSSHEQDQLASAFGDMHIKSRNSSQGDYLTSRSPTNEAYGGRLSSMVQRPVRDDGFAMMPNIKTPSPTSVSPDEEWRPYHTDPISSEAISAAREEILRQEVMRDPRYAEEVRRFGQTLVDIAVPNQTQERYPVGNGDNASRDRLSPEQTYAGASGAEFSFRNRSLAGGGAWPYPEDLRGQHFGLAPRPETTYIVIVFKLHRAAVYYLPEGVIFASEIKSGDMLVVTADRGEDVGVVYRVCDTVTQAEEAARRLNTEHLHNVLSFVKMFHYSASKLERYELPTNYGQDLVYKSVIRKAGSLDRKRLLDKEHDEVKAKRIAEQKARERGLPMEILDVELQADKAKMTIYYISEQYVVFKELVDDMYKLYKMRVWMSSVNQVKPGR